jgi:transmembrane sensor
MSQFYINKEAMDEEEFRNMETRKKILTWSTGFLTPAGKTEDQNLEELLHLIKASPKRAKLIPRKWLWAAAVIPVFALIYTGFSYYFGQMKVRTEYAENKSFVLPDHSEVVLNADSKITYARRNFNKERSISLSGEAFLKIQKGNDFTIHTPSGVINILGTELNILSRDSLFKVTCVTGKVKVTSHHQIVIIEAGENAEWTGGVLLKKSIRNAEKVSSWKDGEFYFEDSRLVYIFDEIERQFRVSIEINDLEKRFFTGSFSNKNLIEALNVVCIPMNLKYEIKGRNKVVISPKTE